MNKKNYLTIGLLLLVLAVAGALFYQQSTEKTEGPMEALMTMEVINGEMISESDLASRPTLVVKWATWCPSCVDELLYLKESHDEFAKRVNLVAVNITRNERNFNDVINLLEWADLPFLVLADKEGKTSEYFPSRFIPANFLINTNGELVESVEGPIDLKTLDNWLNNM